MKKVMFICALLLFATVSSHATNTETANEKNGTITGKIIDASLNEPLPYVNVIVKNEAGETITGGISDDEGSFKITGIPEGKNIVNIQYIGFKTVTKEVVIGKGNYKVDFGGYAS